ncbi:hypothetical protein A9Q84_06755 [Halobacteriovorax marinus]|uniref:Uroporphyrinogen decarboxylase (URO-D) domain-containing protein n=1 Tax=Halobacteriovorax marinus TaxID=97084 RepID=A0A1Y5F9V2_9BACT|nr:hypothetical protein A9Q84_06755 [Halobacteriovorax marinus]
MTNGKTGVPVWFMRQAGRYHSHYQNIKKDSDFMTMCKTPSLANDITHGPIDDFGFDAAILFSDLLFPLEQLGMGLSYKSGPPTLERRIHTLKDLDLIKATTPAKEFYKFQKDACSLLRASLAPEKTLLGFVGAPFTLYSYAAEGSHAGNLTSSKLGLYDGRFQGFLEKLLPELVENMTQQVEGGADAMCLFDTAVGELHIRDYKKYIIPALKSVTKAFKAKHPDKKIIYYSKLTHINYLHAIEDENIDVLGVDWRMDLSMALNELGKDYYVQGNFDPSWLHLPWEHVETNLQHMWQDLQDGNVPFEKWICGLGHGVLQHTPEDNVRNAVKYIHENFLY